MSEFPDFDQLVKLAQTNPEELERLRQTEVEKLIGQAPASCRQRLRGLQFQIDAQRRIHADSPMGSCIKISVMMHESFAELRGWLNQITGSDDPLRQQADSIQQQNDQVAAKVLPFPAN
ncbi:MAG: DUF3135 domain-containing protein [Cellvibrionaceae bacterium]|nr:DUF3135 domain-containing protein [Cellvibrionaceae bacterium]